jgi:hypothetical protein
MCPTPLAHCELVAKKVCVVVPVALRPSYSVPAIAPLRVQVTVLQVPQLVRVKVTGPTKLPLKSVTGPWGDPGNVFVQAPTPVTRNDPPPANVALGPESEPPVRAPVEKLT